MNWPGTLFGTLRGRARQRGLALIVVLWAAVLLALIAGGVARLSRTDLNLTRNLAESTQAELAADGALWTAVYQIVNGGPDAWRVDGTVYAWRFGDAEVRVRVTDETGRIDINAAPPELLGALFVAAGVSSDEAAQLAEAVVEFRTGDAKSTDPETRLGVAPPAFALTDGLAQVPGISPDLQRLLASSITVYTGQPRPRSAQISPLVGAAIEGRADVDLDAAEPVPELGQLDELGDNPAAFGEPDEPAGVASPLVHIEAEAATAGGTFYAREAVIALNNRGDPPYQIRLWRRGVRSLFPVASEAN
ncbi:MAG TPA: hypothetical protein VLA52_04940 [Thermohalobaculum sp.]|nr:hypothetical protein [Thermohalobaculum sp.]